MVTQVNAGDLVITDANGINTQFKPWISLWGKEGHKLEFSQRAYKVKLPERSYKYDGLVYHTGFEPVSFETDGKKPVTIKLKKTKKNYAIVVKRGRVSHLDRLLPGAKCIPFYRGVTISHPKGAGRKKGDNEPMYQHKKGDKIYVNGKRVKIIDYSCGFCIVEVL